MIDKILIHTCCADCLLNALSFLEEKEYINQNSEILSLFYNPNIHPRAEYLERLNAVKKILPDLKKRWSINIIIPSYSPKEYMSKILLSKGKNRCDNCWEMRIKFLFEYAKKEN
ncbi:MAG TPA: epoxyqueuosine reductase QueH, partial [Candidatus Dojkabacteria bacterium]|nr:epoxyqueuosine reductase QueH [Candidatus Dojkabacteria bacterium]